MVNLCSQITDIISTGTCGYNDVSSSSGKTDGQMYRQTVEELFNTYYNLPEYGGCLEFNDFCHFYESIMNQRTD